MKVAADLYFVGFSEQSPLCHHTFITCEDNVTNFKCPDSMKIFLINGSFRRMDNYV